THITNKKVGNNSAMPLQDIVYNYNIRGWLTSINNLDPLTIGIGDTDVFKYHINYNNSFEGDTSKQLFNGNISSLSWWTANDNTVRGYGYNYDHLNRLNYASHLKATVINDMWFSYVAYNRDGQYAEDLSY